MNDAPSAPRVDEPAISEAPPSPSPANGADAGKPSVDHGDFTVQLSVELEEMAIPLKRLQALSEGAVLPLDAGEGPIPVRVMVGGCELAKGTLVSVGPGYGVLIDEGAAGD